MDVFTQAHPFRPTNLYEPSTRNPCICRLALAQLIAALGTKTTKLHSEKTELAANIASATKQRYSDIQ